MDILVARDTLHHELKNANALQREQLGRIVELDGSLHGLASSLVRSISHEAFNKCRTSRLPESLLHHAHRNNPRTTKVANIENNLDVRRHISPQRDRIGDSHIDLIDSMNYPGRRTSI